MSLTFVERHSDNFSRQTSSQRDMFTTKKDKEREYITNIGRGKSRGRGWNKKHGCEVKGKGEGGAQLRKNENSIKTL